MNIATQYAKALISVDKPVVSALKEVLKKRGHEKLLPTIFREFEKLQLREKRLIEQKKITPELERKRILLELYQKLVNSNDSNTSS